MANSSGNQITSAVGALEQMRFTQCFAGSNGQGNFPIVLTSRTFEVEPPIPFETEVGGFNGEYEPLPWSQNRVHAIRNDELPYP